VSGHTHQAYDCTIDGRLLTSAASYGRLITQIDLALDPVRRELVDAHARNVPVTRDIAPDPEVARLVAAYEEKARPVTDRIVGHQRGPLGHDPRAVGSASCEHPMGDVIADAQLAATAGAGADLALMNPGGVRADLVPPQGQGDVTPIRYGAAFEVQPFANRLVTVTLTGKELQTILERQFGRTHRRVLSVSQGFTYRYRYDATSHTASVDAESMRLRGKPVEPAARYRVTVNSFLADGGDEFGALRDAPDRTPGPVDIDALVDYLTRTTSAAAPLTAPPLTRVTGNGCE
jgi:5'-nucleotidase